MGKRKQARKKTEQLPVTREQFLAWRSPRYGLRNPSVQDNPVWDWLFRSKINAFQANELFNGPCPFDAGPCWSNDRFGQTTTYLPDGRTVYIAGEHEDSYDPDFCIYNDVVVESTDGKLTFYGYPTDVFAPTDFHTATLLDEHIWIIGNLGYQQDREDATQTPIYRLNIKIFAIEAVTTKGDSPGRIFEHSAAFLPEHNVIQVMSGKVWENNEIGDNHTVWWLHVSTLTWEKRQQQQPFTFHFRPTNTNIWLLLDVLRELESDLNNGKPADKKRDFLIEKLGHDFNVDMLPHLYQFPFPSEPLQHYHNGGADVFWTLIDGIKVSFEEDVDALIVTVDDTLSKQRIAQLHKHLLRVLEKLHGQPFTLDVYES